MEPPACVLSTLTCESSSRPSVADVSRRPSGRAAATTWAAAPRSPRHALGTGLSHAGHARDIAVL